MQPQVFSLPHPDRAGSRYRENTAGKVVGIETKANKTVNA